MLLNFRVFGIQVRVQFWFVVVAVLLGMIQPWIKQNQWNLLVWISIVFFGVLSHELGHALVGRVFGWTPHIELVAFGGLTRFEGIERSQPWQRMLMIVSGPFVNAVFGIICLLIWFFLRPKLSEFHATIFQQAGGIQIIWAIFNIIPILPLDGGHFVLEGCKWILPSRGAQISGGIALLTALLLAALGVIFQEVTLLILATLGGVYAWQSIRYGGQPPLPQDPRVIRLQAYAALQQGDAQRVVALAIKLIEKAEHENDKNEGLQLLAWGKLFLGQAKEAKEAIDSIASGYQISNALQGAVLFELGQADESLVYFEKVLPRINPWVESYVVRAIMATRRWGEAEILFNDDLGKEFSPASLLSIMMAARQDGAFQAAQGIEEALKKKAIVQP